MTRPRGRIVFDVLNLWHITPLTSCVAGIVRNVCGRARDPWVLHSHGQVGRILVSLALTFQIKGFYVVLPTRFPNLCDRWPLFAYGLQDSPFRYFGSKLVYVCEKST